MEAVTIVSGLTTERLAKFKGGQLQLENKEEGERLVLRGQIEDAKVEEGKIWVRFRWLAAKEEREGEAAKWSARQDLEYTAKLKDYSVADIKRGRIAISSRVTRELGVFFPSEYRDIGTVDASMVQGL